MLSHVRPGRDGRLRIRDDRTYAAIRAAGTLGQLTIWILRDLVRARRELGAGHLAIPFTENAVLAVARKRGTPVSQKKARAIVKLAITSGLLVPDGYYLSDRRGHTRKGTLVSNPRTQRIPVYRLACSFVRRVPRAYQQATVGKTLRVKRTALAKRRRWWEHPLFGSPDGRPPPGYTKEALARMRSEDEEARTWR